MAITNKELADLLGTVTVGADHTETLNAAYQKAFGRDADAEGLAYWSDRLDNGLAATDLLEALLDGADAYVENAEYPANVAVNATDKTTIVNKLEVAEAIQANTAVTAEEAATILATVTTDASKTTALDDVAAIVSGETFVLTTSATDSAIGTANNDLIEATQATYNTGDIIVDSSTTDSDKLNLTTSSSITATPTVTNIENINIEVSKVGGFTFEADNISGAKTVTVNRVDFMDGSIDGTGTVTINDARAADFVAGTKVSNFTVNMSATANIATAATVNATAATGDVEVTNIGYAGTTISGIDGQDVTVAGDTAKATINLAGEVSITNDKAGDQSDEVGTLTLNATDTADITLDNIGGAAADKLVLNGDSDVTLNMTAAAIDGTTVENNVTGTTDLVLSTSAAADLEDVAAFDTITLDGTWNHALTVNSGQVVRSDDDATSITYTNITDETTGSAHFSTMAIDAASEATNATEDTVTVTTMTIGSGAGTDGVVGQFDTLYLDATAAALTVTTLDAGGDTDDTDTNAEYADGADVVITGTKDVTIGTLTNAASVISSSTGVITLTAAGNYSDEQTIITGAGDDVIGANSASAVFAVNLGNGENELTITDAAADSSFVTGSDADTVTVTDGITGAVNVNTGAGNDTVVYEDDDTVAHKINLGTGNNTLDVSTAVDAAAVIQLGAGNNTIKSTADTADLTNMGIDDATTTAVEGLSGTVTTVNISGGNLAMTAEQFNAIGASFALDGSNTKTLTIDASAATEDQTIDMSSISLGFGDDSSLAVTASGNDDTITVSMASDAIALDGTSGDETVVFKDLGDSGTDTVTNFTAAGTDKVAFSAAELNTLLGLTGDAAIAAGDVLDSDNLLALDFTAGGTVAAAAGDWAFVLDTDSGNLYLDVEGDTNDDTGMAGIADDILIAQIDEDAAATALSGIAATNFEFIA